MLYTAFDREPDENFLSDATIVDRKYPVDRTVKLRIDFENWFANQTARDQEIINDMAYGETTSDLAKKYKVSAPSISCYRKKYADSWYEFICDSKDKPDLKESAA